MPVQPLGPEARQRLLRDLKPLGQLVFYNGVNRGMQLRVREFHSRLSVILGNELDPLALV